MRFAPRMPAPPLASSGKGATAGIRCASPLIDACFGKRSLPTAPSCGPAEVRPGAGALISTTSRRATTLRMTSKAISVLHLDRSAAPRRVGKSTAESGSAARRQFGAWHFARILPVAIAPKPVIKVDGDFSDWVASERIDFGDVVGYSLYASAQSGFLYFDLNYTAAVGP